MSKLTARQFVAPRLIAPTAIPKQVSEIIDTAPALEIGVEGSTEGNGPPNGVIFNVIGSTPGNRPPPVTESTPKTRGGPVRIGGQVAQANLIRQVQPAYPAPAKSARVQGSVEFTATISKEGEIENLQLVRGHPLLVNAAREAVSRWKYRPTLLNGQPVEVVTDIVVNFSLNP
jgi:protein TonB